MLIYLLPREKAKRMVWRKHTDLQGSSRFSRRKDQEVVALGLQPLRHVFITAVREDAFPRDAI